MKWIILVASATHLLWGILLLGVGEEIAKINALAHLMKLVPNSFLLGLFLVCISLFSLSHSWKKSVVWCLPQQIVMVFSAFAAIESTVLQQFADGAPYPWYFILPDQAWHVFNGIGHTCALWQIYGAKWKFGSR